MINSVLSPAFPEGGVISQADPEIELLLQVPPEGRDAGWYRVARQKLMQILNVDESFIERVKRMFGITEAELLYSQAHKPPAAFFGEELHKKARELRIFGLIRVPPEQRDKTWEEEFRRRHNLLREHMRQFAQQNMR